MVSSEKSPLQSDDLLIIQCPECFTRFTVNTELVARAAAPRFHCSRCDHVFPIQEAGTQSSIETEEHREPPHTETQQTAAEYDSPDLTQPATPDVPQPSIESPQADMEHNEHEADANLAEDLDHTSDHTQAGEPALDQIQEDLFSPPSWEQSDAPHGSVCLLYTSDAADDA